MEKTYLGDGVYAANDGYHIVLMTQREDRMDEIYLESEAIECFFRFIEKNCGVKIVITKIEER